MKLATAASLLGVRLEDPMSDVWRAYRAHALQVRSARSVCYVSHAGDRRRTRAGARVQCHPDKDASAPELSARFFEVNAAFKALHDMAAPQRCVALSQITCLNMTAAGLCLGGR